MGIAIGSFLNSGSTLLSKKEEDYVVFLGYLCTRKKVKII